MPRPFRTSRLNDASKPIGPLPRLKKGDTFWSTTRIAGRFWTSSALPEYPPKTSMPCARNGDAIAKTKIVAALNPVTCMCSLLINQNCTDRPMDGATGNPFRRPLLYWPVRATVRSVDSTLYSFLPVSYTHLTLPTILLV